jgi:hypothetical protein
LAKKKDWEPYYIYVSCIEFWRRNLDGLIKHLKRTTGEPTHKGGNQGKEPTYFA